MTTVAARKPTTRLNELTATEMAAAVAAGGTTSEAIVRACIERIEAREREVLAWQYFDAEQAIAQARAFDRSGRRGALGGVPFGIKDIIDTCDMPTEMGSPIYAGHRPRGDAACRRALPQGGRRAHGQDRHDGVREPLSGQDAQPVRCFAHARRLVAGLGRGGG